jgi:hypothetical protein
MEIPILTDEEIEAVRKSLIETVGNRTSIELFRGRGIAKRARDDTIKKIVKWGNEPCPGHEGLYITMPKRSCSRCWRGLEESANADR